MITTDLEKAKKELQSEGIIAIPTETVYGLAGNAYSEKALKKIYELKQRPLYNPLIAHIKSAEFLPKIAKNIPDAAFELANAFWPGALTLVLEKKSIIPDLATSGKDTVAIRVPNHSLALKLLDQLDFPLAAPSANPFGSISPTSATHVADYFKNQLQVILDGGPCKKGIESTIVGFEDDKPIIYRLGSLSIEQIQDKIGPVLNSTYTKDNKPSAPGMLTRHYAPATETCLTDDVRKLIAERDRSKTGLLLFKDSLDDISHIPREILSRTGNLEEAGQNLYAAMHRLDRLGLDLIIAERLPDHGLGQTINDKLERATKKES